MAFQPFPTDLGRRVFEREPGRDLQLTPDGEVLLTYARQMLRLCDEARSRLMEPRSDESGPAPRLGLGSEPVLERDALLDPHGVVHLHVAAAIGRAMQAEHGVRTACDAITAASSCIR